MKKPIICLIILIILFSIAGCKHKSYSTSVCPYCGASKNVEGKKITMSPARFPSENPPKHMHFYIMLSGCGENGECWDGTSGATEVLYQLRRLNENGQLSEDVIEEWFSINVGNPKVLKAFADKYNLEVKSIW